MHLKGSPGNASESEAAGHSFEKRTKARQPKHNKSSEKPKWFHWKTESQCFFFFFMQPIRAQRDEPGTVDNIVRGATLEYPACKFSQPACPAVGQSIQTNSLSLSDPCYLFLTLHQLSQAWEEAEKEKSKLFIPDVGLSRLFFFLCQWSDIF